MHRSLKDALTRVLNVTHSLKQDCMYLSETQSKEGYVLGKYKVEKEGGQAGE